MKGILFSADGIVLALFWGGAAVTWLSSLGYLLILTLIVRGRGGSERPAGAEPGIAVVVPTLNEEALIGEKIADIQRSDFPRDKIDLVIVDGGSEDGTVEKVKEKISGGQRIKLFQLAGTPNKADQINHVLRNVDRDIIVFSDADSRMAVSCVRELVAELEADPAAAIIGATVSPRTGLLAERIHWWFLNELWWLEGEVFFCAGVPGVCFAVRRKALLSMDGGSKADDIRLGLEAGARGFRVRLSRRALATEIRVPQTVKEFLQFRRRRGSCYAHEVLRFSRRSRSPIRWRLLRLLRLWQFLATPILALAAVLSGLRLAASRHWPLVILAGAAFLVPAVLKVFEMAGREEKPRRWALSLETVRFLVLFLLSLLVMRVPFSGQGALGGKRP